MSLQFSRNELRAERVEGKKEKYFYKLWVKEYSGMFVSSLWFPSAAGSFLTFGPLVWWMTLWHYFSPERHWGPGCPCPGCETFLWVFLYSTRRQDQFSESTRSCWACMWGGGGFINTYNLFYTGLISLFSITAVTQIKIIITFLLFCINNNNELVCHCDHLRVWEQRFIQKDEKYLMKTCLNPNLNKPKLLYII